MPSPDVMTVRSFDGAALSLQRLRLADRPRLILSHGNGFAMGGYRVFWTLLAADFELVLFDLRNHGSSGATPIEAHTIGAMANDHVSVASACRDAFGARETFGVFHSVSAIAATLAGQAHNVWDGVVLIDPPLVSLDPEKGLVRSADERLAQYARNREKRFDSVRAYAALLAAGIGRYWVEGAALDMAQSVTRAHPEGGVELVCPGEYEARIYEQNGQTNSYAALGAMKDRVAILGADADAPRALHPARVSRVAAEDFGLPYVAVAQTSHMLQIENPKVAAAALRGLLKSLKSA
ncbi:MAG: alpha/beta hydrolase [Beijerinckiaceae bacterium]|nr:alpha/beta hydrolase [Beijerinckiaceae bacterium]